MRVVGYRKSDFTAKDGTEVKGYNLFLEEPVTKNGKGIQTDKIYLSEKKVADNGIDLDGLIGKNVSLAYNKWGKVAYINIIEK